MNKNILWVVLFIALISSLKDHMYGFKIFQSFEIKFDYEVTFFDVEDQIMVWDDKASKIYIYEENQLEKTINAHKGQGPQDFEIVSAVLVDLDHYYVWDRILRRFSIYKKNWDFVEIKTFHNIFPAALPLGVTDKGFLLLWNDLVRHEKGSTLINNIGLINADGQKHSFYKTSGAFNKMGKVNYNRPILLAAFSQGGWQPQPEKGSKQKSVNESKVYFANNQEYKIYAIELNSKDTTPSPVIERKVRPIPWRKDFEELQWEINGKPSFDRKCIYPGFVPPLFSLAAHDDMVAIITNEGLQEKKTIIDFFKAGKFIGTAKLPLLYSQYFVFPSFLNFPPQVLLGKDYLITFFYDTDSENFKITKWKIEQ